MSTIIRRRRRTHSNTEYYEVLSILDKMQILLSHTCVHKDQPVLGIEMAKHVAGEVHMLCQRINELSHHVSSLGYLNTGAYMRLKKSMLDFKHIMSNLHTAIHGFIANTPNSASFDNIKDALHKTCPILKEEFDNLVEDMFEMGLISHDLKLTHTL